jgi:putative endonuclease
MFYTYVLKSHKNDKLYIGSTNNLKRRFTEHNQGKGGKYAKDNKPFELIYYEAYNEYNLAKKSERFFKTGYGKEVLKDKLST